MSPWSRRPCIESQLQAIARLQVYGLLFWTMVPWRMSPTVDVSLNSGGFSAIFSINYTGHSFNSLCPPIVSILSPNRFCRPVILVAQSSLSLNSLWPNCHVPNRLSLTCSCRPIAWHSKCAPVRNDIQTVWLLRPVFGLPLQYWNIWERVQTD
jgi:hypothetical protein